MGRRGQQALARMGAHVVAAFPALSNHPTFRDVLPVSRIAIDGFLDGSYDRQSMEHSLDLAERVEGWQAFKGRRAPGWIPEAIRPDGRL